MEASYQGLEELSLRNSSVHNLSKFGCVEPHHHACPVPVSSEGDSHGQKAVVLSHSEHPAMVHVQTEGGNISKAAIQDNAVSKPLCEGFLVHRVICISLSLHEMQ